MNPRIKAQLERSAAFDGGDVEQVLRRILHIDEFSMRARHFPTVDQPFASLLDQLDAELCARNPGLHYVSRATYVGYRREEFPRRHVLARSQVFVSVPLSTRRGVLVVLLPLDPKRYELSENMRDVSSIGHHGVGDLEVTLRSPDDITQLFERFGDWLGDPAPPATGESL
ncbi:hypothetical protein [Microbacterium imperiale]|uniref:hypothetical protein n=1 Tax=Microbacterium imperiale TaxID=33884 RepID=UPI001AEA971A|nr:hypothetical protein [Microbacterium imperiale]MBP2422199.1 putative transport protein [Microbacterium imperiale]MDS0200704.1 hypothetical protein [Microbacterium imperiale]